MQKKSLPLADVYRLLEPGPVVLLTTSQHGKPNVMTMSWHTMMDFEPPTIGCIVSNRDFSFNALVKNKECVINIPDVSIAKQAVGCGNCSGKKVDKFKKFHLTPLPAATVNAPLIDECFANLECKVIDSRLAGKYNFFVLQVKKAWISKAKNAQRTLHHRGKGVFMVAGKNIKLASKAK